MNLQSKYDITDDELSLFGDNVEKIHKIRFLIKNFDELLPANKKKHKKIDAKTVLMILRYCNIEQGKYAKACKYFFDLYTASAANSHEIVTIQAINRHMREILRNDNGEYEKFVDKLKLMLKNGFYAEKNNIA